MSQPVNERGLVSLLATVIISLLLTVIVVAMVGIMALLQRQSTDQADSVRAHYAAEAGVENGLLQVEQALATPNGLINLPSGCNNSDPGGVQQLSGGAEYTCLQFSNITNQLTGDLTADGEPVQLDLSGLNTLDHIVINWNLPTQDAPSGFSGPNDSFPATATGVVYNDPAVLELITTSYPVAFSSSTQIAASTNVIEPSTSGPGTTAYTVTSAVANAACSATVTASNPYNCSETMTGFNGSSTNYILRLKARYAGTHYQIQAYTSGNAIIPIPDEFETVDVTAKVGDAYQRLVEKVPINSGVADLDYVLFSDTTICKDYSITNGILSGVNGGTNSCS